MKITKEGNLRGKLVSITTYKVNCASDTSSFETLLGMAAFVVLKL